MKGGVTKANPRGTGGTKCPVAGMKCPAWGTAETVLPLTFMMRETSPRIMKVSPFPWPPTPSPRPGAGIKVCSLRSWDHTASNCVFHVNIAAAFYFYPRLVAAPPAPTFRVIVV